MDGVAKGVCKVDTDKNALTVTRENDIMTSHKMLDEAGWLFPYICRAIQTFIDIVRVRRNPQRKNQTLEERHNGEI